MRSPLFGRFNNKNQNDIAKALGQVTKPSKATGGLTNSLRSKIAGNVMEKLGGLGTLVEALLRPFGQSLTPEIEKEAEAAAQLLKEFEGGREPVDLGDQKPPWMRARPEYRISSNPPPDDDDWREPADPRTLMEPWIKVQSSNVYAISYRHPMGHSGPGDLLVTFLGGDSKNRHGAGASYAYKNVRYEVFQAFKAAASKGKFVWDELRVRGTVSGHQYEYDIEAIGNLEAVPRQAATRRGMAGEHYVQRTLNGQRSTLPNQQVRGPRGNLPGWDRRHNLKLRAGGRP